MAAHQAPAAIEEALEAEVPLIVAVAEHIPLHDMLRVSAAFSVDLLLCDSKFILTGQDSLHAQITIQIPSCWAQFARHHLCRGKVSDRSAMFPTNSDDEVI